MRFHPVLSLVLVLPLPAEDIAGILSHYTGSAEQNAALWRNLDTLRHTPNVPPDVIKGFNAYRVQAVQEARQQVVRKMMASGQYAPKDLAGFINTGTWNDAGKFALKSDIDFTAIGRNPEAVKAFRQDFMQTLSGKVGLRHGHEVIGKLDVNVYTMGGTEPGAFKTAGGRRFFEVYSAKTGGYEAITGSGANATVSKSHIDSAFHDLGKSVPRFTPGDAAGFASELNQAAVQNASSFKGHPDLQAKANAKLVERAAYADAVGAGKAYTMKGAPILEEAAAMRAGKSVEEALSGRIGKLVASGMSREEAVKAASKAFANEAQTFVNNTSARLANQALKAEANELSAFQKTLGKLGGGGLVTALRGAAGAASLYQIYSAYKEGGNKAMALEIVKQGLYHTMPITALAELAGMGVKIGGEAFMGWVNNCKADSALSSMFGKTEKELLEAYQRFKNDPAALKAQIEKDWEEQSAWTGVYRGKGYSSDEVLKLIQAKAEAMMKGIGEALEAQKNQDKETLRRLQHEAWKAEKEKQAKNADRKLSEEEREKQERERKALQDKEKSQQEKDKADQEKKAEKPKEPAKEPKKPAEKAKPADSKPSVWDRITAPFQPSGPAASHGGTFPAQPFNELQITYAVSGLSADSSKDGEGFTHTRAIEGRLGGSELRVSGTAKGKKPACNTWAGSFYSTLEVTVWVDDKRETFSAPTPNTCEAAKESYAFNVAVPIPRGARSGGFSIREVLVNPRFGNRGLVVAGQQKKTER